MGLETRAPNPNPNLKPNPNPNPNPNPSPNPNRPVSSCVQTPQEMLYNSASTVGLHRGSSQPSSQSLGAGQGSSSNMAAALPGVS